MDRQPENQRQIVTDEDEHDDGGRMHEEGDGSVLHADGERHHGLAGTVEQ